MYHSYLIIDTGGDPDKPRPGRKWLNNIYQVHQRLSMGFPSTEKVLSDPFFLEYYQGHQFTIDNSEPVNKSDKTTSNRPHFLFRIEHNINENEKRAIILVQSDIKPNWEYAFQNAKVLLADVPIIEPKEYSHVFHNGESYRFRIEINLSKKSGKYGTRDRNRNETEKDENIQSEEKEQSIQSGNGKKIQGKRVSVIWEYEKNGNEPHYDSETEIREKVIKNWFANKVQKAKLGFEAEDIYISHLGWKYGWKHKDSGAPLKFRTALLEGKLIVTDSQSFTKAIHGGIGSAKAFGLGLLSVRKENHWEE